jgi:hypothetical protein
MFSSSGGQVPKKRGCITRYLVADVSTQRNVLIFRGPSAQEERMHHKIFGYRRFDTTEYSHRQSVEIFKKNFSCRLRYDQHIVSKQREPNTQRRSAISHTPSQRNPKNLQILRNYTLFSTKKNTGYKTEKSRDINLRF